MNVLICAYYTTNGYERIVKGLNDSLRSQGLSKQSIIKPVDPFPSWNDAVVYKPEFILSIMKEHPETDGILYVDADAKFVRSPDFSVFDGVEVAFMRFKRSVHVPEEFLTGTMYFANTPAVQEFVEKWAYFTPRYKRTDCPEQSSLKDAVECFPDLAYLNLPPEWVWIWDTFNEIFGMDHAPIVKHYQASRKMKRLINLGKGGR